MGQGVGAATRRRVVPLDAAPESAADATAVRYTRINVPLFMGVGAIDYACHGCDEIVCEGLDTGDLVGLVVRCGCGAVNRIPGQR